MRFYGGRSLFGGLWEPAGERKRSGVVHVLDNFPESKFFLIGDTGMKLLSPMSILAYVGPR
jgi:phosphatidate phosphatase APP1